MGEVFPRTYHEAATFNGFSIFYLMILVVEWIFWQVCCCSYWRKSQHHQPQILRLNGLISYDSWVENHPFPVTQLELKPLNKFWLKFALITVCSYFIIIFWWSRVCIIIFPTIALSCWIWKSLKTVDHWVSLSFN